MQILAWNTQARYTDNEATSNDSGRFLVSDDRNAIANPAAVIDGVYPASRYMAIRRGCSKRGLALRD